MSKESARPDQLAYALAYEARVREAASGPLDVLRADVEADVLSTWQVGHHGSGPASDVQNAIAGCGTNVFP